MNQKLRVFFTGLTLLMLSSLANADPITIGYEFSITGAEFLNVTVPSIPVVNDPDGYDVELFDDSSFVFAASLNPGETYNFVTPVALFRIMGIDPALGIDPFDLLAFPVAVTFTNVTGEISLDRSAIVSQVPEPATFALLALGLAGIGYRRKQLEKGFSPVV